MDAKRLIEKELEKEKEREAEPVMIMLKMQVLEGTGYMRGTRPIPRYVYHCLLKVYSEWESTTEMTHKQFKHYESLLDDKKIEKARRKIENRETPPQQEEGR